MVRLKDYGDNPVFCQNYISIPHGTIKSVVVRASDCDARGFQFHMVRLKGTPSRWGRRRTPPFQFHMVRLKAR